MEADIGIVADITHRLPGVSSTISECDVHCPARSTDS